MKAALWLVFGLIRWSTAINHGRVTTVDEAGLITTGGLTDNHFYDSSVMQFPLLSILCPRAHPPQWGGDRAPGRPHNSLRWPGTHYRTHYRTHYPRTLG